MAGNSEIDAKLTALRNRSGGTAAAVASAAAAAAAAEEIPAFGFQTVDFVKTDGQRWGFPYAGLSSLHMDKGKTALTARFTFQEVTIKGRALDELYDRILNRAVGVVSEATKNARDFGDEKAAAVESIEVNEAK